MLPVRLVAVGLVALLFGCPSPQVKQVTDPAKALEVRYEVNFSGSPLEGEIARLTLRLKNVSPHYVFLKSLTEVDSGVGVYWQKRRGGSLKWDSASDEYIWNRYAKGTDGEPMETLPIFNHGLLVPPGVYKDRTGTKREFSDQETVTVSVRLLKLPKLIRIEYFAMSPDQVVQNVFFPRINEHMNDPKHADFGLQRFVKTTVDRVRRYSEMRLVSPIKSPFDRDHFVYPLYPDGNFKPNLYEHVLPIDLAAEPRRFRLEDAAKKAGVEPTGHTFCSVLSSWILESPKGAFMVNEAGAFALPEVDLNIFFAIDTNRQGGMQEVEFLRETHLLFDQKYNSPEYVRRGISLLSSEGPKGRVYLLRLPDEDLADFLRTAGEFPRLSLRARATGGIVVTYKSH